MRKYLLLGIALICHAAPAQAAENSSKRYTIEQLMASDTIGGLSWSPDDTKLIFTSNRTGIANIYVMPATGGEMRPLTSSTVETVRSLGYFPHDERILYTSDQGGNERAHIYVRETDGTIRDTTPGERHVARFVDWAHDGRSFFVQMNDRDPRYFDLYEIDAASYARTKLFENDKAYQIRAISPDRRYVGLSRIVDNATKHCYVYDRQEAKLTQLTPDRPVACEPQAFATTGSTLYYTTDDGGEFTFHVRQDLASGARKTVFKPRKWDVVGAGFSNDGRQLIAAVNEDGRNRPYLFDAATLRPIRVREPKAGASTGILLANSAPLAAVSVSAGDTPGDVYIQDLRTGRSRLLLRAPLARS